MIQAASSTVMRMAVVQLGARRHYAVPWAFEQAGVLDGFYTDLWAGAWPVRLAAALTPLPLRPVGLRRLTERRVADIHRSRIHGFPLFGIRRVLTRKGVGRAAETARYLDANAAFGRLVARQGLGTANTVYAFNGAAREVFIYARQNGMQTVLDQTSAPLEVEEALLAEEYERWPGWEAVETNTAAGRFVQREREEWQLADRVICGSRFLADCLVKQQVPVAQCAVVPYGLPGHGATFPRARHSKGPLRVLFVGHVRLLKGVQYLMRAAERLNRGDIIVNVVGQLHVSDHARAELNRHVNLVGPVRRSEMAARYEAADLLVLPSLCEGSANVAYEALGHGLPVIATPNAGTVIEDGCDGFIVPPRDPEQLAERIALLADDRDRLDAMSAHAAQTAKALSWNAYAECLFAALKEGALA